MYHEMKFFGFAQDPIAQMPVIILKDAAGEKSVPIWISMAESIAFAAELVGQELSLQRGRKGILELFLEKATMKIELITIESLHDGVFKTSILFVGPDKEIRIEVQVSDAITMALKCKMPVMVSDEVLQRASSLDMRDESFTKESNARRFVDFLDNMDPSAMGKYPM